jgi:pimeloyl-ACP methyl ester carboxylesterase
MREVFRWVGAALGALMINAPVLRAQSGELPRKAGSTAEFYRGVVVLYDTVRDPAGHRLRLIVTHPQDAATRAPVIFVAGWLSCDSVEAPPGTADATQLMLQAIAKLPGFATVRMDKPGVGDSEGDCAATDFIAELAAYRQAFRKLKNYSFVDSDRIFIFGISNGGGFAPLVAEAAPVRGYVVDGGWIKTWYEHMLEIERRRLTLAGHGASELNTLMKRVEEFYSGYLLDRLPPQEIFARRPEFKNLWDGDPEHLYGRPVAYYQQLQDLDLMTAWSGVKAPLLALHGEFDWIMSRGDLEIMVGLVNHNVPGSAELVDLPATGHTFEHYASQKSAFEGKTLPFDDRVAQRIGQWFERHR